MPVNNQHISIPKKVATKDDLDFYYLREKGIEYIQELGGSLWTDFNSHDPGITMLEMLCYAITDLGMRIDTPINNLLASANKNATLQDQFYKASEVFPSKAVTRLDYRKLFIDIEGVRNCWLDIYNKTVYVDCKNNALSYDEAAFPITPTSIRKEYNLKGLYQILVDYEDELTDEEKLEVEEQIRLKYHANRNLCEDLIEIKEIEEQSVAVCANIEVHPEADEELVHAKILLAIENYFATNVRFYSIKEMLEKGYTTDEIFEGPVLEHGFIDTKELKKAELRREVRLSDLMKLIMNIEGVKLIKEISIGYCNPDITLENDWVICLEPNKKPILCEKSTISYNKGVLPLNINEEQVATYIAQLKEDELLSQIVTDDEKVLVLPDSNYIAPDFYTTIQNDFPDTYGIGQSGLAAKATPERKAQAKQLKGYLIFFDKILATYFKHLSKVSDLLSISGQETKTYFTQVLKDIKGFEELVEDYNTLDDDVLTTQLLEELDNNIERRNEILDHLLARFAESFGEYTFLMKALYGSATNEIVLANKEAFLNDYVAISSERGAAFNYFKQEPENLWDTNNISGVQKRIARLVGMKNYDRRTLSSSYVNIYSLLNSDSKTVFRWRIKDEDGNIILSATTEYNTISAASEELYFSVRQIIQVSEKNVQQAFSENITDDTVIDNIRIHISDSGKYSFDIINPEEPTYSTDYIIAKQYKYYDTEAEIKEAILSIITFMKFKFTEEGIFLVEHILLRPDITKTENDTPFLPICTNNCEDDCSIDPYSYRVSIVLPGYTYRFSNPDFRNYMEGIIKEALPAHVLPKICWVGYREDDLDNLKDQYIQQLENNRVEGVAEFDQQIAEIQASDLPQEEKDAQIAEIEAQKSVFEANIQAEKEALIERFNNRNNDLVDFETAYKAFLLAKTDLNLQEQPIPETEELITAIQQLNTIYPVGRLLDCDDESDEIEGKIILGQTNIGTL